QHGAAADHLYEQRVGFALADQPGAEQGAAQDADVDKGRALQEQEEDERGKTSANAVALPQFPQGGEGQGEQEAAERAGGERQRGGPVGCGPFSLAQGDVKEEAEVDALEDVLGLQ